MEQRKFKITYIDNLDDFYHPFNADMFPPLFHGTRQYAIECDQSLIEQMKKHCFIVLEKVRDYYNTLSYEVLEKYQNYGYESGFRYFASYLVQDFGKYKNYEYNDFYVTTRFEKSYLLVFTKYGFGEIGEFAYHNIMGLKHFEIDLGIDESFDFILSQYPNFIKSEPIVLIAKNISCNDLRSERGYEVDKYDGLPNYRLINPFDKELLVIKQELFDEATQLFDKNIRKIVLSKLNDEEILIGRGWLHDIFYMGGLIEYKRTIPLEKYGYIYTECKSERAKKYFHACNVICGIFRRKKIKLEDLAEIDEALLVFNKRPFGGKLKGNSETCFKNSYELSKYLSMFIFTNKQLNIEIEEKVFSVGKRNSFFARTLYFDRLNYRK